jgi:hypothetical protein
MGLVHPPPELFRPNAHLGMGGITALDADVPELFYALLPTARVAVWRPRRRPASATGCSTMAAPWWH